MKIQKIITAVLAFTFVLLPCFASAPESAWYTPEYLEANEYEQKVENEFLQLFYNGDEGIFAIRQKDNGYVWYSAPLKWDEDEEASGFVRNSMPSTITVRAKDVNSTFRPANSYVNAFNRGGLKVSTVKNGVKVVHNFKRDGYSITMYITLDGKSVLMSVPVNEITEDTEMENPLTLLDFQINPYFGAAGKDEEGFIFVPDGSGAVIEFNNHRSKATYSQYVYGRDKSIVSTRRKLVTQDIYLPVFGMSREKAGFIGVIESGASRATINAESCQNTSYNQVSAGFIIRDFDSVSFRERSGTSRDVKIYEAVDFENSEDIYSVRYIFLDEENNNLTGMANAYRKYLQSHNLFPKNTSKHEPLMALNFIGAAKKKRTIAGFPMNVVVPYTKFSDVTGTVEELEELGVDNFNVKIDGWVKGGFLGPYPSKAKPSSALGGNRGFKKMMNALAEKNVDFYAGADFVNLYETDSRHIKETTVNRMINRSPVKIPDYRMSTYTDEKYTDKYPYWILRTPIVARDYNKFMATMDKKYEDAGFAPDTLGNVLSSDFVKSGVKRTGAVETFIELLSETAENRSILLSRPFDYALPYVSYVSDLPVTSSQFDVENYSVPFYQMVLHGFIPYSNLPGNRNTNSQNYKLKLLETGADISYMWICRHPDYTRDSRMQSYMNLFKDDWVKEAADLYREIKPVLSKISGASVTDYSVNGNVRKTTYSNGISITVDYDSKTYSVESNR